MKKMSNGLLRAMAGIAGLVTLLTSREALAFCDGWQMSGGGRELVFGEAADGDGNGLGYLAICEQDLGGGAKTFQTFSSCTASLSGLWQFVVYGGPGSDRIGPLTSDVGPIACGSGHQVLPYSWSFGLYAEGGLGSDRIYGTANLDLLFSNYDDGGTFTAPSDGGSDKLCGFDGEDGLIGDGDDANGGPEECLDGGAGTGDVCWAGDSGISGDLATSGCESVNGGFRTTSASAATCTCTAANAAFWSF